MTVEEIRAKLPNVDIYELSPDFKYIFVIHPAYVSRGAIRESLKWLDKEGVRCIVLSSPEPSEALRILEVKE